MQDIEIWPNYQIYLAKDLKNAIEHEVDGDTNNRWVGAINSFYGLGKEMREIGNQSEDRDYTDYSIVEIS